MIYIGYDMSAKGIAIISEAVLKSHPSIISLELTQPTFGKRSCFHEQIAASCYPLGFRAPFTVRSITNPTPLADALLHNASLTHLNLNGTAAFVLHYRWKASLHWWPHVPRLHVAGAGILDEGARVLCDALAGNRTLSWLNLASV